MRVFAVHGEHIDLDKYQRFEAVQLDGSAYQSTYFEEPNKRKDTRGISSRNFKALIKLVEESSTYPEEPLVIATWGGPMYMAIRGRMAFFDIKNISIVDLSIALERLLFTTDLDILSKSLGIPDEYSSATKILDVYRNIRHITKELQYVMNIPSYRKEVDKSYADSKLKYRHLHTTSAVMTSLRQFLDKEVYYIDKLAETTSEDNAYAQRLKVLESQYLRRAQRFSRSAREDSLLHKGSYNRRDTGVLETVPEIYNREYQTALAVGGNGLHQEDSDLSLKNRELKVGSMHFAAYKTMYVSNLAKASTLQEILDAKHEFQKIKSAIS